jgi:hypothetical protein
MSSPEDRLLEELVRRFPRLRVVAPGSYVVGGAVRDLLRGAEPNDVDVATPDPLSAATSIRSRVIQLGADDHLRAYRVIDDGIVYDFAEIVGGTIERDLARRDLTIDAMAVDIATGALLDLHDGRRDLSERIVRMISASNFDDDPLRMLKAVRMAVVLGFEIDPETMVAIQERSTAITRVAAERVTYELSLLLGAGRLRRAVALLETSGLGSALDLRLNGFESDEPSLAASLALLVNPSDVAEYAARWRWSDGLHRDVIVLQRLAGSHDPLALYDAGRELAAQLPAFLRAIGKSDDLELREGMFEIESLLSGEEIMAATGLTPGPELGRLKRALVEAQVLGRIKSREAALEFVTGKR